jgi:peptidoglycan/xylan/chitin deacetylase (PgdA/CDA1 family)
VGRDLIRHLKDLPNAERELAQQDLETQLGVELPAIPPLEFAPMTWDQVRSLGRNKVWFGPHTVTHPILARTSDEQSQREIGESWRRLGQETDRAVPVFCWPNGDPTSFGPREVRYAREAGMVAAFTTVPALLTRRHWSSDGGPYALPRYAYPQDAADFAQVVSGLERLKGLARMNLVGTDGGD